MKKFIFIMAILFCLGCMGYNPPMNVIMTNPETGKSVYVAHQQIDGGIFGGQAAMVQDYENRKQQDKAIKAYRMMGYTEMKVVE